MRETCLSFDSLIIYTAKFVRGGCMNPFKHDNYDDHTFEKLSYEHLAVQNLTFESCRFHQCQFSAATWRRCRFIDCEWIDCNLSTASFKFSRFTQTTFDGCKMIGINWTEVDWPRIILESPVHFYRCNLSDSSFYALTLLNLIAEHCQLHNVDFRAGNFSNSQFTESDFQGSLFVHTKLEKCDFRQAVNYLINPLENKIQMSKFSMPDAVYLLEGLDIEVEGL